MNIQKKPNFSIEKSLFNIIAPTIILVAIILVPYKSIGLYGGIGHWGYTLIFDMKFKLWTSVYILQILVAIGIVWFLSLRVKK